jgi:hypothetical protein
MKGRILVVALLAISAWLFSFSQVDGSYREDDGGSAPYLLGDAEVIAIFVSTPDRPLTRSDMEGGLERLEKALDWIVDQCPYEQSFTTRVLRAEKDRLSLLSMEEISDELFGKSLTEVARDELEHYDSFAFLFILGGEGRSYAMPYDPDLRYDPRSPQESFWGERAVIYMRKDNWALKDPATYAHELLHLYGARDKYDGLWVGQKAYPIKELEEVWFEGGSGKDIMSSVSSLSFIDEITRGEIGWGDVDGDGIPDPLDADLKRG